MREGFDNYLLINSIQNLKRLGLVDITYENLSDFLLEQKDYEQFKHHFEYKSLQERWELHTGKPTGDYKEILIQKGIIQPSTLGFSFLFVMYPDPDILLEMSYVEPEED
ncbi:DUF4393 domain-containing protein [Bacillus sp. ISL-46]|nr:DUF4393 domain-containing protein [Bacillus sp. ISL-46]